MVFPNFLRSTNCKKAFDGFFGRYEQHDSQKELFNFRNIGNATRDSVFDCLLSLTLPKQLHIQTLNLASFIIVPRRGSLRRLVMS